jgi:SAM-dependent methyltransferase
MSPSGTDQRSYSALTEGPGGTVAREGAEMLRTRYQLAADHASGRRVLEIGCGPGVGLGLIDRAAEGVVGADYDDALLRVAASTYGARIPFICLDAQKLPFRDASFDLILFFEGTYYVPDMDTVFDEVRRVVADGGEVLFVNANPDRPDFIRSPKSVRYHSAEEFRQALIKRGFEVEVRGGFPLTEAGIQSKLVSRGRKLAESLGLIPRTLAGRAALKRLLFGKLVAVPAEMGDDFGEASPLSKLPGAEPVVDFKVIYVAATMRPKKSESQ